MGTISEDLIKREIDNIAQNVEELSAMSGGMLYKDILYEVAKVLCISLEKNKNDL